MILFSKPSGSNCASKRMMMRSNGYPLSSRHHALHLSGCGLERVCVSQVCGCERESCRDLLFLESCGRGLYLFQICGLDLLPADAIRRSGGRRPILPDAGVFVVDEAHKLSETARQIFSVTLEAEDIRALDHSLRAERPLAAEELLGEAVSNLTGQFRQALWQHIVLTSGTLTVGEDFRCFKEKTSLLADSRVRESVFHLPFDLDHPINQGGFIPLIILEPP